MGIKDNFDNALRKAITLDPIGYREILKNSNDIEEVKTHKGKKCNEVHPGVLHSKWVNQKPEEEMDEATTAGSSGSYETPQMWAKNAKNWRGAAKTQWPGGQFVKIKDKCKKFPYCNQGDINALDLSENKMVKHAIQEVSKKTGKDKNYIKKLVKKEMEEIIRRSIYKSPITSILGPETKMDKPIGKIYSMGSNVGGKYE